MMTISQVMKGSRAAAVLVLLALAGAVYLGTGLFSAEPDTPLSVLAGEEPPTARTDDSGSGTAAVQASAAFQSGRERVPRYYDVVMTPQNLDLVAAAVALEAGNQPFEGQQAVAEVVFNRVVNNSFPDSVDEVLWQEGQFAVMSVISYARPTQTQYDAVRAALYGPNVVPADVVYFATTAENERVWGQIGDHIFCREYIWN